MDTEWHVDSHGIPDSKDRCQSNIATHEVAGLCSDASGTGNIDDPGVSVACEVLIVRGTLRPSASGSSSRPLKSFLRDTHDGDTLTAGTDKSA